MNFKDTSRETLLTQIKTRLEVHRQTKFFRPITSKIKKYRFVAYDTETYSKNNLYYMSGVLDYNEEYKAFYDLQGQRDYLKRIKHNDVLVVATNLAFDYLVTYTDKEYLNKTDFLVNKGSFICCTLRGTYTTTKYIDTLNYGRFSVEKMGNILGIPKLSKPRSLGRIPRDESERLELEEYNKRDVEVTYKFMYELQRIVNGLGGELKLTLSSCAMNIFTRKYLRQEILSEDLTLGFRVKDKLYKAYYGGRTETYKRGTTDKDLFYYDVNSLYPFVMLDDFPDPNTVFYKYESNQEDLRFEGVSYFELVVPKTRYPVLPFRNKEKKLLFPYGRVKGYYTHLEVRYAKEFYEDKGGLVISVMRDSVLYKENKPFFKEFILDMYSKRLEEQERGSYLSVFYKLIMNSLYGRFALKEVTKTDFFIADTDQEILDRIGKTGKGSEIRVVPGGMSYTSHSEDYDGVNNIPVWSVYVTSLARILLHKYISLSDPVYCDTDSVVTEKDFSCSKDLGGLKLEEFIPRGQGVFVKPKIYFTPSMLKVKGVRSPSRKEDESVDEFFVRVNEFKRKILSGEKVCFEKFVKVREGVVQGLKVNSVIEVEKLVGLDDDKRCWGGKSFVLDEFQDSEPLEIKR